jgi:hypothetical protein
VQHPLSVDALAEEETRLLAEEARLDAELSAVARERAEVEGLPLLTLKRVEEWFTLRVGRADYEAQMLHEQHAAQSSVAVRE